MRGVTERLTIGRRYLPHWQAGGKTYFVTFRAIVPLSGPARTEVLDAIAHYDEDRYDLDVAVAMPDHVHALLTPLQVDAGRWHDLNATLGSVKSFSARRINAAQGTRGQVWQHEGWDRIVRDSDEFMEKRRYILWNPVKAGLVEVPSDYPHFVIGRNAGYVLPGPD